MGWSVVKEAVLRQKDKIIQFWNRLSGKQRIFFCTGVAVIAVVALLLTIFAGRPKFVPLYTNLDPQDAASITEYLKEKKILYKLENGGATILVPEAQKDELRLSLANEGIPKGGSVGFESFNQTRFGETESERRVRYLVALQGELERTISKLDPAEDVRVHIVIPEPSLFLENEAEATAAVLVKLKPGSSLKEEQVYGIMHLVASGVEGLKSENVTVVDTKGNILSGGAPSEAVQSARMTTDQMEIEREYEKNLERSLKGMLEQIVGQGKAVVRANATLDFDRVEIRRETFGDKTIRSQQVEEENTTSGGLPPAGTAGTPANIPTYEEIGGGAAPSQTQINRTTTNYEIDKEDEYRVVAPGAVKQLSLSVVLDGELDPLRQQEITDLVSAAAGLQPERGDQLTVASIPFDRTWSQNMEREMAEREKRRQWLIYGIAGLILISLLVLLAVLANRRRERRVALDRLAGTQLTVEEALAAQEPELTQEEKERARILEQLQRQVRQNPEQVAQVLRAWLAEEQR